MTAQIPEILRYRDQEMNLCAEPLYDYLRRLRKSTRPNFCYRTSACLRRYIGTWEIIDNQLYLVGIEGTLETPDGEWFEADMKTVFPRARDKIAATWVTDRLRCVEGRVINYHHRGFASTYERERFLDFERGELVDEYLVVNPPPPIAYKIAFDGKRKCIDDYRVIGGFVIIGGDEIPDPLEGESLDNAWKVWGRKPDSDEPDHYFIAAAHVVDRQEERDG